jgi:hypothetical protein
MIKLEVKNLRLCFDESYGIHTKIALQCNAVAHRKFLHVTAGRTEVK